MRPADPGGLLHEELRRRSALECLGPDERLLAAHRCSLLRLPALLPPARTAPLPPLAPERQAGAGPRRAGTLLLSRNYAAFHAPGPATLRVRIPLAELAYSSVTAGALVLGAGRRRFVLDHFEGGADELRAAADVLAELHALAVDRWLARAAHLPAAHPPAPAPLSLAQPPQPGEAADYEALAAAGRARRLAQEARAPVERCRALVRSQPARLRWPHAAAAAPPPAASASGAGAGWLHGTLYLTPLFMCFSAPAPPVTVVLALAQICLPLGVDPLAEALRIGVCSAAAPPWPDAAPPDGHHGPHARHLHQHELWVGAECVEGLAAELQRLVALARLAAAPPPDFALAPAAPSPAPPGVAALLHSRHFSAAYREQAPARLEAWAAYVQKHGPPRAGLMRTRDLAALVRAVGVPDELRAELWLTLSGAALERCATPGHYEALAAQARQAGSGGRAADEIERDLRRTLPDHPWFHAEDGGLRALRAVLRAYAIRTPAIGYCQSMNFVAALLLLFLPEPCAFHVLALVCERFLPRYYSPDMLGSMLDQRVFERLVAARLPRLSAHLAACGLPIALLSLSWFLCLYSTILPLQGTLRLLDIFLLEGERSTVLFELGLALLTLNEPQLLALPDPELICDQLRATDLDALFAFVLDPEHAVAPELVDQLRCRCRIALVRSVLDEQRARDRRRVRRELSAAGLALATTSPLGPGALVEQSPGGSPAGGLLDALTAVRAEHAPRAAAPRQTLLQVRESSAELDAAAGLSPNGSRGDDGDGEGDQALPEPQRLAVEEPQPHNPPPAVRHAAELGLEQRTHMHFFQRYLEIGFLSICHSPKLLARLEGEDTGVTVEELDVDVRARSASIPIHLPPPAEFLEENSESLRDDDQIFSISL